MITINSNYRRHFNLFNYINNVPNYTYNMFKYIEHPFILFYKYNNLSYARLGYYIKKNTIKYAHERNLIKRIIKEQFRINQKYLPNFDIIICILKLIYYDQINKKFIQIKIYKLLTFLINKFN